MNVEKQTKLTKLVSKKIALIGNMNNNFFSAMRYFRDLGVDAHLFVLSTDGAGPMSHFSPEADTWNIEKWCEYIHYIDVPNNYCALLGRWRKFQQPPSKSYLRNLFLKYDYFIGTGLVPAILSRIGIYLDIFVPYTLGIEHLGDIWVRDILKQKYSFNRIRYKYVAKKQANGIRQARYCINADFGLNIKTLCEIGKPFIPYFGITVYNNDPLDQPRDLNISHINRIKKIRSQDFVVLSHMRQHWIHEYSGERRDSPSKHNDWLIKGFASFQTKNPKLNSLLVLFEYGNDVDAAKKLCMELRITEHVLWVPKLTRKELICYLEVCDVGVGAFFDEYGTMWGGTGWEIMSIGKPLLQSRNFTDEDFLEKFGCSHPPILCANSSEEVFQQLQHVADNPDKKMKIGAELKNWFDTYNGIGLARKWLNLL